MRTRRGADALFPNARKQILSRLLMHPGRSWFLSDLARHLGSPKTSLQRELANLEGAGIILRETQGRQVYFKANPHCPYLPELQGLIAKTSGLVDVVRDALQKSSEKISVAFLYGSIARGEEVAESDVDLMVIGSAGLADLALPIRKARERLAREVNPTVYSPRELALKAKDPGFTKSVLAGPKIFVVGTENDLERTLGAAASRPRETGTRRDRSTAKTRGRRDR